MKNKKRAKWKLKAVKEVDRLIRALGDEKGDVRATATEALGEIADERAVEPLITALGDEEWSVRVAATESLGRIGDKRAVEALITALEEGKGGIHESVIIALGKIGDKRAVKPLIKILLGKYEHNIAREAAARALGEIGDIRAVEPLMRAFRDGDDLMQSDAGYALEKIANSTVASLINELKNSNMLVFWDIGITNAGEGGAVKHVLKAHRNRGGSKREYERAITMFSRVGKRAIEPLIDALGVSDVWLRLGVAAVLCQIGEPAVEPLIDTLEGEYEDEMVQLGVRFVLNQMGESAVEPLINAFGDGEGDVHRSACVIGVLKQIGEPAIEPLINTFGEDYKGACAAMALLEMEEPVIEPLINVLGDRDKLLYAICVLRRIGEPTVVPLINVLGDENPAVRYGAAFALGEICDKRAVEPLINALGDADCSVRRVVARALGKIGDIGALFALEHAADDSDRDVRKYARKALDKIKSSEAYKAYLRQRELEKFHQHIVQKFQTLKRRDNMNLHEYSAGLIEDANTFWRYRGEMSRNLEIVLAYALFRENYFVGMNLLRDDKRKASTHLSLALTMLWRPLYETSFFDMLRMEEREISRILNGLGRAVGRGL